MKIIVFGASHEMGYWDKKGGWVQRLSLELNKKSINKKYLLFKLYNLGIAGNTTEDLLLHMENDIQNRILPDTPKEKVVFIFNYGTSDSCFRKSLNTNALSQKDFLENLNRIASISKNYSNTIAFLESPLVDEDRVNPVPWNEDFFYKNKNISEYNNIKEDFCKDNEITFIRFPFNKQSLSFDGLHQNSKGHKYIFGEIWKILQEKNIV